MNGLLSPSAFAKSIAVLVAVERLTAEREVVGSIPGVGLTLMVLKWLRNEGTVFALQMARPSRGSDDHVKIGGPVYISFLICKQYDIIPNCKY